MTKTEYVASLKEEADERARIVRRYKRRGISTTDTAIFMRLSVRTVTRLRSRVLPEDLLANENAAA